MIQAGVVAQFVARIGAFLRPARDADHPRASELRQLSDDRAHRARRRRNHHCLARLGRDDLIQSVPRGHARHAERPEPGLEGNGVAFDLAKIAAVAETIQLPAAHPDNPVADLEPGVCRGDDFAHRAANHHLADLLRLGIGPPVVHAAAHVGIKGKIMMPHEHLSIGGLAGQDVHKLEIVRPGGRLARWARGENKALIARHGDLHFGSTA